MKRLLLTALIISLFNLSVFAQKQTTIIGDAWTGVVESADDTTREITIVNPNKKTETFVGVLKDGYQVQLKDSSSRELKISEIKPGLRVRAFYKSKTIDVAGQSKKVKLIHRLDFLGRDEHTRVREMLELPPSIPVLIEDSNKLPNKNPLKIHVVSEMPILPDRLALWAANWNNEEGAKYGRVEIVDDPAQADVSLVVFLGMDENPILLRLPAGEGQISPGTVYLVSKDDKGLHVLWQRRATFWVDVPWATAPFLGKELGKKLKARSK
jgi:hypothetical protein